MLFYWYPVGGGVNTTPSINENGNWWIGDTDTGVKAEGTQGDKGEDGKTPEIGTNGNWWIGDTDTGVKAEGTQGDKGEDGKTPEIGTNGNWWIGGTDTGIKAEGTQGDKGEDGKDFWDENPQGLDFFPQDDGTYAVGIGNALYLSTITVPSEFNGNAITRVAVNGFANALKLKKLYLPETITAIDAGAFKGVSSFDELYIGEEKVDLYLVNTETGSYTNDIIDLEIGENAFFGTGMPSITFYNANNNEAMVDVTLDINDSITAVSFEASLNSTTDQKFTDTLDVTKKEQSVNFGTFGLFKNITVKFTTKDGEVTIACSGVSVTADHYNFAHLNATYPVLVFSLKLNEITNAGKTPTFISLERTDAYSWENLPQGAHYLPMITKTQATTSHFHAIRASIAEYIKELYTLNPDSKFTLYTVDNYPELILEFLVANQIPEENWNCVMLSDGAGTAGLLSSTFNVSDPDTKYNEMVIEWNNIKKLVWENGFSSSIISENMAYASVDFQQLERYPYIIAKEQDNVEWIVNRLRAGENLSAITSTEFVNGILETVTQVYTNNLLAALTPEEATQFKDLYHFSDEMFAEARENNKKIMIILGTSWNGEKDSFYEYIRLTMEFYGDDYIYYYKGHPGYPTLAYPERKAMLDELSNEGYVLYELDNAIAAEVILFFNPDVYLAGWQTSTFDSVESQNMACALFAIKKDNQSQFTYGHLMDMFLTPIDEGSENYNSIILDSTHTYFLIEFNNNSEYDNQIANYEKHEIAIFDSTTKTLKYYKWNETNSVYDEVAK